MDKDVPMDIYGPYRPALEAVMKKAEDDMESVFRTAGKETGTMPYEHLRCRLKSDESMRAKLRKKGLPETAASALTGVRDAVGIRIVCRFIDDIYDNIRRIRALPGYEVVREKDYIKNVKPNGYRSYHLIVEAEAPFTDALGRCPGRFYMEIQLRTLAMDSWASLEHEMKYKHAIQDSGLIESELKRCADELASCDMSMQTIRNLIRAGGKERCS